MSKKSNVNILIIGYFTESSKELITSQFPDEWNIEILHPEGAVLKLENADVVIPEHIKVDVEFLSKAKKLKLVQTGAGFDNVDIEACTKKGVWVCNAAGVNAIAVAEHVMALILSWYKNIPFLNNYMKDRKDETMLSYKGSELFGKTIGIIGLGAIGQRVADYCDAFGMRVLGYAHRKMNIVKNIEFVDLDTLYKSSDIVTIHVPLNDETRHMIDGEVLNKMRNQAVLINASRGAIIDERALIAALKKGGIAGAALDVFEKEPLPLDSELRDLNNVILTPHTAGMPDGLKFHKKRYSFFIDNIREVMEGNKPKNALNQINR